MTNQKEQNKRKNQISLIMAILGLIVCIIVIIWLMIPRGNDGTPDPTPDPPQPDVVAREYWTVELSFSIPSSYLKKISVNDKGDVLKIESIHPTEKNVKEVFFYKNGKLDYSETYSVNPISYNGKEFSEEKLYETRYVYMGDIITKAEVYVNGTPTRSYDKYIYKVGGELEKIERYELDRLEMTYVYNGKDYPERVEHVDGVSYDLEYDDNGNLTRATGGDIFLIEVGYENGYPTRFYEAYYDRRESSLGDGKSIYGAENPYVDAIKYEKTTTYVYGEKGEILKQAIETVATTYSGEVRLNKVSDDIRENTYEYDGEGRLVEKKCYWNKKFDYWRRYAYDSEGNLVSEIYCQENGDEVPRIEITRSTDNGLVVEIACFSDGVKSNTMSYKYNEDGNLLRIRDVRSDGSINYEETFEYYTSGAKKKQMRVQGRYSETWFYAENGNLEKYVWDDYDYADGDEITEYITSDVYYGFKRSEGFVNTFHNPLTVKNSNYTAQYEYRDDLTREKVTEYYSNGEYRVCEYDENGKLQKDEKYDANGNVIYQHFPENG